jgi:uncharacterized membrane protein YphA (DoxX/SURF4 family)
LTRIDRVLRIAFALVFLAAGAAKIVDPPAFAISVARLRIVPMMLVGPVAILLPWVEVVAAAALFFPKFRRPAIQVLLGLLVAFTLVLGIGLLRGASSCGCFGSADAFLNRADVALARNAVLLATAGVLFLREPTSREAPASPA